MAEYDVTRLESEVNDILTRFHLGLRPSLFRNGLGRRMRLASRFLQDWYSPNALGQLLFFRKLIDDYTYQDLLKSSYLEWARSARLTTHFDLDFPKKPQTEKYQCHKHARTCQPVDEAEKFLVRYSLDTLARIRDFANVRTDATS